MNLGKFLLQHLVALLATATKTDTTFCSIGFSLLVDDVSFVPRYWQVNLGLVIWHYLVKKHFSNDYLIDVSMNKFWKTLTRGPKNGQFWPPLFVLFSILSVKNFAEKTCRLRSDSNSGRQSRRRGFWRPPQHGPLARPLIQNYIQVEHKHGPITRRFGCGLAVNLLALYSILISF